MLFLFLLLCFHLCYGLQEKELTDGRAQVVYMMATGNMGKEMDLEHLVFQTKSLENIRNNTLVVGKMIKHMCVQQKYLQYFKILIMKS